MTSISDGEPVCGVPREPACNAVLATFKSTGLGIKMCVSCASLALCGPMWYRAEWSDGDRKGALAAAQRHAREIAQAIEPLWEGWDRDVP